MTAYVSYAPRADGAKANDKAGGGDKASDYDNAWDLVVEHSGLYDGLNVFAGMSEKQSITLEDKNSYAVGATYATGGFTLGYQYSKDNQHGVTNHYENHAYGITFSVNDNLSISYGRHESERNASGGGHKTTLEAESIQAAYSMGGATLKVAETSVDHANYDTSTASDREGTTVMLSLAF